MLSNFQFYACHYHESEMTLQIFFYQNFIYLFLPPIIYIGSQLVNYINWLRFRLRIKRSLKTPRERPNTNGQVFSYEKYSKLDRFLYNANQLGSYLFPGCNIKQTFSKVSMGFLIKIYKKCNNPNLSEKNTKTCRICLYSIFERISH